MSFTINKTRWNQIESLPMPTGVGDLEGGLCAIARIVYASTGVVSAAATTDCIAPSIRSYMIGLNDRLPVSLRPRLGSLAMAKRVLTADTSAEAERRRGYLCADVAVRVFAVSALRSAGLLTDADELAALSPIVDKQMACAAAKTATQVTANAAANTPAWAAAKTASWVTADAAWAAVDAANAAVNKAAWVTAGAALAATDAACAAAHAAAWEPAFALLDALLAA